MIVVYFDLGKALVESRVVLATDYIRVFTDSDLLKASWNIIF